MLLKRDSLHGIYLYCIKCHYLQLYLHMVKRSWWLERIAPEGQRFSLVRRGGLPVAIECKWKGESIETASLAVFRSRYAKGENWIVGADIDRPFDRTQKGLPLKFMGIEELARRLEGLEQ